MKLLAGSLSLPSPQHTTWSPVTFSPRHKAGRAQGDAQSAATQARSQLDLAQRLHPCAAASRAVV